MKQNTSVPKLTLSLFVEQAAAREAAEEDAKNKATQPFKQTVLDEEYAKARRMHEREIARSNITMENERQR